MKKTILIPGLISGGFLQSVTANTIRITSNCITRNTSNGIEEQRSTFIGVSKKYKISKKLKGEMKVAV